MRYVKRALAALGLIAALPAAAAAQDMAAICADLEQASVGDWAEYEMDTPQGAGTMRFALIAEGAGATPGPWFELSGSVGGQNQVLQFRVDDWPFEPQDIQAAVVKMGGQPAMSLPEAVLAQMRSQASLPMGDLSESCRRSELLGDESVAVPAGTFDSHKIRPAMDEANQDPDATVWMSRDVPFGIVKTEGADGSMRLAASGDDATSSISEAPQAAPPMPGGMGTP